MFEMICSSLHRHNSHKNILLIAFLSSMTPSATTVVQFSQIYDQDPEYATAINIFTTAVCVVTMPLMVTAFEWIV